MLKPYFCFSSKNMQNKISSKRNKTDNVIKFTVSIDLYEENFIKFISKNVHVMVCILMVCDKKY